MSVKDANADHRARFESRSGSRRQQDLQARRFQVTALDSVTIDIAAGEFLALMGPSGSGKTTLLNMIAAIDRPTSGELHVLGENIFKLNDALSARWRNTHVGYVFQTFNLIPVLTAFENVELPLRRDEDVDSAAARSCADCACQESGDRVNHLPQPGAGGNSARDCAPLSAIRRSSWRTNRPAI
jgi:putative ABC transport system ATP-binding protein